MDHFGLHGKLMAQPGMRDRLVEQLLAAAKLMETAEGCELYVVSTSSDDDAVWVTEIWRTKADHDASLAIAGVPELIRRTRPLVASMSESVSLVVRGGKGWRRSDSRSTVRFIEVSHRVVPGMKTYPGLPEPKVDVIVDYESSRERYGGKAEFFIASLHLCGNTGTYVDSPHHRYPSGMDLADLPLARLAHVPAVVVDATGAGRAIGPDVFRGVEVTGKAVLVRTDFSRHWGTDAYFTDNPFLTAHSAEILVNAGPAFVGIDSLNIDDTADLARPAHTKLLAAGIPICEHMTGLEAAPRSGGRLHAVPIAWVGGATFPVRAYVIADDVG